MVKPIPDGYHTITPHLIAADAEKAIEFYKKAFGAEATMVMPGPGGKGVGHAEMKIGDSVFMLADEFPQMGCRGPKTIGGSPVSIHLYVEDVDKVYKQAVEAGATATMPVQDMFWGDRYGKLTDPFGHEWSVATHIKDLTAEEMQKAATAAMSSGECGTK